jgi:hypothetical protein
MPTSSWVDLSGLVLSLLALTGCSHDRWEPVVYPSRGNLTDYRRVSEQETLEECRAAAKKKLAELGATDSGDYECGLNCDSGSHHDMKICKETAR